MNAPTTLKELLPAQGDARPGVQGQDLTHESAVLHVTGEAVYTDDLPELRGTLYAALVLSPVAHGELIGEGIDRQALLAEHGVVAVFTARDGLRATWAYRSLVARNLVLRFLQEAQQEPQAALYTAA